ncbi:MAG: ATP-dependent DNA helicase RecG [Candidatus Omnitrophica bacterium]|jgi:ATP-dependent DNA helicase RecG|nr:ATP-dependent DNA helicase RecG [Candidatus Omnitrophota bacterium]
MSETLDTSIRYLKGIGPKRAKVFQASGINTIEDLIYYFPRNYQDRTNFIPISNLQEGFLQTIKAEVLLQRQRTSFKRRGFTITEVIVGDESGKISVVWFNQPYLRDYFKTGEKLILSGKVERYGAKLQMHSPEFEIISEEGDDALDLNRLVPVYSLPEGVTQRYFRKIIKSALDKFLPQIKDFLSFEARSRNNLVNLARALMDIHFPENQEARMRAYERLSFDEFFIFQLPLVLRKLNRKDKQGIAHTVNGKLLDDYIAALPFRLTNAQEKTLLEIKSDMSKPLPMQRLLQGDVGSGKTVVAIIASLAAIQSGYQAAIMVPTEILARQHYEKISFQLSAFSSQPKIRIRLLTSSLKKNEKTKVYRQMQDGTVDLVIGTHALLEETVGFKNLGLVVIDEQHKFGVGQRALLPKKGLNPDCLIMTATPIPRTLAITLYGDLDISVINELPAGRIPVKTLNYRGKDQAKAYLTAIEQLKLGRQAYIIYPVIEESYALDMAGAKKMYARLKNEEFKDFRLGLIHGKLDEKEQNEIMLKFKEKELDVLIATTILEVGIDIANASCMIIEHAERFGLAQLHQLRGRVGRGPYQSFCILLSGALTPDAEARINAMVRYNDGFRIAEEDLKIRGPGEFFGRRQHGLTELKIANPLTQMQLLKRAREEAIRLIEADPHLQARQNILAREKLLQRFPEYEKLMVVG